MRPRFDPLGGRPPAFALAEPVAFDDGNFNALSSNLESDAQRFVLLAFLAPESRQVPNGERRLHASTVKRRANQIAVLNSYDEIRDIGGALSGFTQPGFKKDLGLLRKGEKAGSGQCQGRNYYLAAKFYSCLRKLAKGRRINNCTHHAPP